MHKIAQDSHKCIYNSWKLLEKGRFPLAIGIHLTFEVHKPIEVKSNSFESLFDKTEQAIKNAVILHA